ncbi:MAG: HAMP domain-containing sensor histidine kinase [Pseudomonadales bacterium]
MNRRRLTLLLLVFFTALALPTSMLVYQAYGQLKWEAFYQHQQLARELSLRIDASFSELIEREEKRPFTDYAFLNVTGSEGSVFLQRSPLSVFPAESEVPGLLGYFQVDAKGQLRTPIVPKANASDYGISSAELQQRQQQETRIRGILDTNRLVRKSDAPASQALGRVEAEQETAVSEEASVASAPEMASFSSSAPRSDSDSYRYDDSSTDSQGQSVFDELTTKNLKSPEDSRSAAEQVKDLKLEDRYQVAAKKVEESKLAKKVTAKKQREVKSSRKEKVNLPEVVVEQEASPGRSLAGLSEGEFDLTEQALNQQVLNQQITRIRTFESEVEPLEFALLDSGHFVLFRRVWHDGERYIQGLLVDQNAFINQLIKPAFRESSLSSMSELIITYQGTVLQNLAAQYSRQYKPSASQTESDLLYQSRLIAPFGDIELIYTLARLPIGAGGQVIIWAALVLAIVLVGGLLMLYRLGIRQIALARQQQDFVSAVSHELKTPLTSIRMYGEILREGWANEEKKKTYYDFIFHESERLTRLINNVLQLARMSRNEQAAKLEIMTVGEALRDLKPRLESQLEASGFELSMDGDSSVDDQKISIDIDGFIQIFINLVDNAIKFSANAESKRVEIRYQLMQNGKIQFSVRDYGPGIAADQMKKIFKLFYRSENELTRETVGTGIGLALVQQLVSSMGGRVDVVNCEPGAEFRIQMKIVGTDA